MAVGKPHHEGLGAQFANIGLAIGPGPGPSPEIGISDSRHPSQRRAYADT